MTVAVRSSSLRWRLTLLTFTLLVTLGAAFAWTADREMRHALRLAGDQRVHDAAMQLADLLAQSAAARVGDGRRLVADETLRRFVLTGQDPDAALQVLRAAGQRSPLATFSLRVTGAAESLHRAIDNVTIDRTPGPATIAAEGAGPLHLASGRVAYTTTALIPAVPGTPSGGAGVLSIERPLSSTSGAALVERLIGTGAALKFGNAAGDLWTDLSAAATAPPGAPSGATTVLFTDAAGQNRLGTAVAIASTPWQVWVDLPEAALMQPATTLLRRMWPWTVGLILLGVVAIGMVSVRITAPLEEVAGAADAIAKGDYSRRVLATGHDEIGRLASAFNVMAAQLAESREALEARVEARTQELLQTREVSDQFFSLSLDLLCIANFEGHFTQVNPEWEIALGWTAADLTGRPYLSLVHPDDVASTMRESAAVAAGNVSVNFENRYLCKDGTYRWLNWKACGSPQRGEIYATARDVTDVKRAGRDLEQHAAELSAANRELESFSYSVSHDLRAPLRSIDGFSQALLEDCADSLSADGQAHLRRIRAAAQHMGQLIDDLLKLARITRADLRIEPVDLSGMAQGIMAALHEAEQDRVVQWTVEPGLTAKGDSRLLQVLMTNLLENAWKFTGKTVEPRIEFGARGKQGAREFFVKDNGAGFDPTYAAKLFGAFQRLHHPRDFAGTGVGLATVQRIVSRHGGRVGAEGLPGLGATFSFTLQPEVSA